LHEPDLLTMKLSGISVLEEAAWSTSAEWRCLPWS